MTEQERKEIGELVLAMVEQHLGRLDERLNGSLSKLDHIEDAVVETNAALLGTNGLAQRLLVVEQMERTCPGRTRIDDVERVAQEALTGTKTNKANLNWQWIVVGLFMLGELAARLRQYLGK